MRIKRKSLLKNQEFYSVSYLNIADQFIFNGSDLILLPSNL